MPKRKKSKSNIYHVVARGTGKQIIFEDENDKHFLHALLNKHLHMYSVVIYAWCFMDNHIHILLRGEIESVSKSLKLAFELYAMTFNKKYKRSGHLFQEAFKSEPIDNDSHFLSALRYIHQNPIKANLSRTCCFSWSSFNEYCGSGKLPSLCDKHFAIELFGGLEEFLRFHKTVSPNGVCIDIQEPYERNKTRGMRDEEALSLAKSIIGASGIETIKSWPRAERNAGIVSLCNAGLTYRQLERLTGISRGIIYRTIERESLLAESVTKGGVICQQEKERSRVGASLYSSSKR